MGRMYTVVASSTQTTAGDILALEPNSSSICVLHSIAVTQGNSETDDSTTIELCRVTTSGSAGSAVTPAPLNVGHAASGVTCRAFDTTDAAGTVTKLWAEGISTLAGFYKIFTPEERIHIPPSGKFVARFTLTVASVDMVVSAVFEELD